MLALLALPVGQPSAAAVDRLSLKVADVANPAFTLHDIRVFDAGSATAEISVARARVGGRVLRDVRLRCARAALSFDGFSCHGADLRLAGRRVSAALDFELDRRSGAARLAAGFGQGGRMELDVDGGGRLLALA